MVSFGAINMVEYQLPKCKVIVKLTGRPVGASGDLEIKGSIKPTPVANTPFVLIMHKYFCVKGKMCTLMLPMGYFYTCIYKMQILNYRNKIESIKFR